MRLRVLETNAGTVLVLDKIDDIDDVDAAMNAWTDREGPRPFVLAYPGEVEIPLPDDRFQRWYQGDYYSPPPAPYTSPYTYCTYKPGGVAS